MKALHGSKQNVLSYGITHLSLCRHILLYFLAFQCSLFALNSDVIGGDLDITEMKLFLNSGPSSSKIKEKFQVAFGVATKDSLLQAKSSNNDSIALRSAWEHLRRAVKIELREPDELHAQAPVPTTEGAWFLGFLEGRLRHEAPDWWRSRLANARMRIGFERLKVDGNDRFVLNNAAGLEMKDHSEDPERAFFDDEPSTLLGQALEREDSMTRIIVDSTNISINTKEYDSLFRDEWYKSSKVDCTIVDTCLIIAVYEDAAQSVALGCFDVDSGKQRWSTKMECDSISVSGAGHKHFISLVGGKDVVFVYQPVVKPCFLLRRPARAAGFRPEARSVEFVRFGQRDA